MNNRQLLLSIILPAIPIFTSCSHASEVNKETSAYTYKEVFLPEGTGKNAKKLGLNNLDNDWAIWGHNLSQVLPDKPSETIYAKINGSTNRKQFCFSSTRLYDYITDYIRNNYTPFDHARFSIIPNDNDIVCLCVKCVEAGNTVGDASPAVMSLINKLATKYPNHIFYTSDYRTTRNVPEEPMLENTGVLVSAMPYPLTYDTSSEEIDFMKTLDTWSQKTGRILIWDYVNNFDDYFTPYPNFGIMSERFKKYRFHDVNEIFLNGSGRDASSFSHLKTLVFAELLKNPDLDWQKVLSEKVKEIYPESGEIILDFLMTQENFVRNHHSRLPMYEGVKVAKENYLPEQEFMMFYDRLKTLRNEVTETEAKELDLLLSELAYTKLELARINGNLDGTAEALEDFEKLRDRKVEAYSESGWQIDSYVRDYNFLLDHAKATDGKNILKGVALKSLTPLDPDYRDISVLTDGVLGMPSNYHNGHLIITPDTDVRIEIPVHENNSGTLNVWLSYNPGYRISLPMSAALSGEGMEKITRSVDYPKVNSGHYQLEFPVPGDVEGPLYLTLKKDPDTRSIAIEEIEFLPN